MSEELHRRRRARRPSAVPPFLKAYWVEILIVIGLLLGIFLMFERIQIRVTLLRWLNATLKTGMSAIGQLDNVLWAFITGIGLSELIAIPLLTIVFLAIVWRARWRAQHTPALTDLHCPRCGGNIHRVHRRTLDRLASIFVPVRRYHCTNRECGWSGVRVATRTHIGRPRTSPE
jgi:uncharacterized membrane protein